MAERGDHVISKHATAIDEIRAACATTASKPHVFCEEWGKPLIASQPWVAELIEAAGGNFLGEPGKTTSFEAVAHARPEVLIAAWCGAGDRVPLERFIDQREWQNLPAVRDRRVFCINDELLNTPASNLVDGLHAIAWALIPTVSPATRNQATG